MSDYFCYLLHLLTQSHDLLRVAIRIKPTPEQDEALKYWCEEASKPVLARILGKKLKDTEVLKVEEIFEVIDIK